MKTYIVSAANDTNGLGTVFYFFGPFKKKSRANMYMRHIQDSYDSVAVEELYPPTYRDIERR